ncbi:hypothetical protein CANMA_003690 [Candida margitis]|uniref:uncharacterized protein n=1 Tax=Candida margitis TaxID=1775924 RepID=UPI002226999B|nr:uncharacterized protein CANMA_003690 [Candida margitis]KAI5961922.1 hypothetical protein CANMA_003690 [Candida margitis]
MNTATIIIICLLLFSFWSNSFTDRYHNQQHHQFSLPSDSAFHQFSHPDSDFSDDEEKQLEFEIAKLVDAQLLMCEVWGLPPILCRTTKSVVKGMIKSTITLAMYWISQKTGRSFQQVEKPKMRTSCYISNSDGLCIRWRLVHLQNYKRRNLDVAGFGKNCTENGMIVQEVYQSDNVLALECVETTEQKNHHSCRDDELGSSIS